MGARATTPRLGVLDTAAPPPPLILVYCDTAAPAKQKGLTFSKTCNMSRRRLPASVEGMVLVGAAAAMLVCVLFGKLVSGLDYVGCGGGAQIRDFFVDADAYEGRRKDRPPLAAQPA